jgi:hypothetical protein
MATTTFSGPIKAGTISNTTGTTLGDDVSKRWSSCNVSINYD